MKKYSFVVDVVADDLDIDNVSGSLERCLNDDLPDDVHVNVKSGGVTTFSEQGYKVWRARVTGVTAKQAGDAANPKASKGQEALV